MEIEGTTAQKRRRLPTIAKPRIIHIFAPEIIKTDVSNFREVVQNLTGKEDYHHDLHHQKGLKIKPLSRGSPDHDDHHHNQDHDMMNKSHGFCVNSPEDEEEEMVSMTWNGSTGESSGGFLNGLGDFDGFIPELEEFPYLPLDPTFASSSHLDGGVFAESHQFA